MAIYNTHFSGGKNYDSDHCGSIPLNFINLIQAHGALLVMERASMQIIQASENTADFLGIAAGELLQQSLQTYLGEEQLQLLHQKLEHRELSNHLPLSIHWSYNGSSRQFSGTLHIRDRYLLLEIEELPEQTTSTLFSNTYQAISYAIASLKEAQGITDVARIAATELKKLSGFERVMVYRFDGQWNGTVIAETLTEGMEPYLGLRFPASDVPKNARELYFRTPFRIIPHAGGPTARLYPVMNPLSNSLTDISDCILRAVPLVHIEYLQNMGVAASMSTPIIVDNQLWGLISCHHRSPKPVSFELRTSFEIISGIVASQLSTHQKEEIFRYRTSLHQVELKLLEQIYSRQDLQEGLLENPAYLLELLDVQGVVYLSNHEYQTAGLVPHERQVRSLIKWLSRYSKEKIFTTDSLPRLFAEATDYREVASGLIALQISSPRHYLLGFRPEVIKAVNWGGDPNNAINFEANSKRYHPRNSFNLWREQVELTSDPWHPQLLDIAQHIRTAILEKLLNEED